MSNTNVPPRGAAGARCPGLVLTGLVALGLAVVGGASPTSAAPAPSVVDLAAAGCDYGCLATRPSRWLPDREPRMGLGIGFYQLRWKNWGTARASATGVVRSCAQADCRRGRVSLVAYRRASTSNGFIYTCLRLKRIPVEPYLVGSEFDIDADADRVGRC